MTQPNVRVAGDLFLDAHGRQLILRGVNLGGDCKVPFPNGGTQFPSDFADHRDVSFVGRPFPLDEAREHFARIRGWGFNTLRLLTTWEAVEHAGPGLYDEAYLDYFAEVARLAGEHGLNAFIDFHQDVWARMSGGDGAPGWTFEAAGLDFATFHASGAALVMQNAFDYADPDPLQAAYPRMCWSSNYRLPANGVMWTLFWGGRAFTPDFRVDGRNIQDFLQGHYLGAMAAVAARLAHLPNVIGFDSLNEPGVGWCGLPLSWRHLARDEVDPMPPSLGVKLSVLDQLAMLQGQAVAVPILTRDPETRVYAVTGEAARNPDGVRVWSDGRDCPFERAGLYRMAGAQAVSLREDGLRTVGNRAFNMSDDAYAPFFKAGAETIRAHNAGWALFAEMDPYAHIQNRRFPADLPERTVNASHWYDTRLLHTKTFNAARGLEETRERYRDQLGKYGEEARAFEGGAPALIGEFGTPYDLDEGEAYARWNAGEHGPEIWAKHQAALSATYDALDDLLLHSTQWNYTAANRNDLRTGDNWNQEDLSIWSADQAVDGADGGRATQGFSRPYAQAVQGRITAMRFDAEAQVFRLEFNADPSIDAPTEIFLAPVQFPNGVVVETAGAACRIERAEDVALIHAEGAGRIEVTVRGA
ncbi:MAG: endoglucanase [Caulobacter sp.]|nr:endoglucanase [Caulobacter sp.]